MPDINTRITDYSQTITQMVEKGLLDIWGRLGEYRDFLVVIGGLVPRYITAPEGSSDYDATTHCGTGRPTGLEFPARHTASVREYCQFDFCTGKMAF